ncbi:MAG: four helix bundle protein [Caldilineaceae bacterium]|nr:four helix bundle protein [Caldilineaceae bacterium]MCB0140878.1 four helix bundle protein [Caldilineaceae bacterium]
MMPWKNFEEWLEQVPDFVKRGPPWDFAIYQKALFLSDLAWFDAEKLLAAAQGRSMAWQLVSAAGSVPANIEEGYGRGYGKDYARFLRISLGSARETQGWYIRSRHIFSPELVEHRYNLLAEIISGLIKTSTQQRKL